MIKFLKYKLRGDYKKVAIAVQQAALLSRFIK